MEKITKKEVKNDAIIHQIYCDNCNCFITASEEWDDGYYYDGEHFDIGICIEKTWYKLKKVLCDDCRENYIRRTIEGLKKLGFKEEK